MNQRRAARPTKQKPAALLAVIDVLAIGLCLLIFAYFDHVRPEAVRVDTTNVNLSATVAPLAAGPTADPAETGGWRAKFADQFVDGEPVITENSYKSRNVSVTLTQYVDAENKLTYYVQDVYVAKIECLRNVFAKDTFGKGITEEVESMSQRVSSVGAINGDYYGHGSVGVVIRNGELYRESWAPDQDVMVLFRDGTMRCYTSEREFDAQAVMAEGAWQAWCFGPSLLDANGELLESYPRVSHDPRTILGMVEPGHYMLIVVDGRQGSYSEGTTHSESARLCKALGCTAAYNLDGGKTSQMTFRGQTANRPYEGGRKTSDMIYIADID